VALLVVIATVMLSCDEEADYRVFRLKKDAVSGSASFFSDLCKVLCAHNELTKKAQPVHSGTADKI
jgi:hypothetical protein